MLPAGIVRYEGKCEGKTFALTLTLTTEPPINRAFQPESEGVRVKNKKKLFFRFLEADELTRYEQTRGFVFSMK